MNQIFIAFLLKLATAIAKQVAIAATPVALSVAEAVGELLAVSIRIGVASDLTAAEKKELYGHAWGAVLTTVDVAGREGAALAEEIVTLAADAAAAQVESALGM